MPFAVLFPRYDHPAVEERYASWQSETLLRRDAVQLEHYDDDERAAHAVKGITAEHVLVVTDPLMLPTPGLGEHLARVRGAAGTFAAVPVSNEAVNAVQRVSMPPYMTLRELEIETARLRAREQGFTRVVWDRSNPGAFLCETQRLAGHTEPLAHAIYGREVAISRGDFIHRWASLRGQVRLDLLERISPEAKAILEFGCGEGALGEALKQRQKCRVVGIELDRDAAARARKRMDDVYCADARETVAILQEKFDWIVGGDIVEHLDEPWSFLADLRRISTPDGHLLLSLPNLANGSVLGDLLHGRFDYVYMGITCVGHLRFFTRRSIDDMLTIAGWTPESIEPQMLAITEEQTALVTGLESAGLSFSKDDLMASGYYVIARNRS